MNAASYVVIAVVTGSSLFLGLAIGVRRLLGLQLGVLRTVLAVLAGSAAWSIFGLTVQ